MDALPVGGGVKNVAQQRRQQRFQGKVQIGRIGPRVRQKQRRFFHFALRQRDGFAARQPRQNLGDLLQNGAVGAVARDNQRLDLRRRGQIIRQRVKLAGYPPTRIGMVVARQEQRRQMRAAQRGGHQRLPGLRAGGNLRRGACGLLIQGPQLVKLPGNLGNGGRRRAIVRLAQAPRRLAEHHHQPGFKLIAGKGLLETGVDQQGHQNRGVDRHP